jgi:aminopeptidase N
MRAIETTNFNHSRKDGSMSRICAAATLLVTLGLASLHAYADTYPRQPGIRILWYTFDVALGDTSDELVIKDTIELQFLAAGVAGMDLDLCQLITQPKEADRLNPCLQPVPRGARGAAPTSPPPAPSSVGRGMTVTGVAEANGRPLTFVHDHDRLHVDFATPSRAGEKLTFAISYHGVPATGLFIGNNRYNDRVFFTDNWPNKARNWLATIDHISVKAPKTIIVTAPNKYHVISNGAMSEESDLGNGLRRTVWTESQPIPSWQYSLGVAPMAVEHFGESHGVPFSAWVFLQNRESGFKAVDQITKSIFDFYWEHIGPYPYEKLAHVDAAGSGGATEPATTIFYYGGGFGAAPHEMAHQWFGDSATESDWDDVWLSEGFATYFALLYTEFENGRDAFLAGVKRARDTAMNYILAHPDDTIVHNNLANISDVFSNSAQIYQGGAMVLQMLRGVVGTDNFWAGIRLYSKRFYNGSASSDDLRHAFEDACYASTTCSKDNYDLTWFFREWLNRGGIMKLQGGWRYNAAAKQLEVTLDQTQTQGLYRMPIEIGITLPPGAAGTAGAGANRGAAAPVVQITKIVVEQQHNVLRVPLEAAPVDVQLDPNLWVPMMQAIFVRQ